MSSRATFVTKVMQGLMAANIDFRIFHSVHSGLMTYSPIMSCVFEIQTVLNKEITLLHKGTPEEVMKIISSKSLVGSSVNLNVFNARQSKAKMMAQASVTKKLQNS